MLEPTILVGVIIGLVEIAKKIGLNNKWCPLLAVILGVGINFLAKVTGAETIELLIGGIVAGLTACGLWDLGKKTIING